MFRISMYLQIAAFALIICSGQSSYADPLIEYNFDGGTDGQLVSGNTGGATEGTLNSSVHHPNTLINAVTGTTIPGSVIKHWSDNPTTETAGGNFVGMTYDTTLPAGAETRAGYDGQAVQFVRSGVLHRAPEIPGSTSGFTAFARVYWEEMGLYDYETLFGNGSRLNQTSWWVGIDWVSKQLTWSFTNGSVNSTFEHPHLADISTPVLTHNTWVDIAVTFEGDATLGDTNDDTLKVYVDGVLYDTYEEPAQFLPDFNSIMDDWSFWTPDGNGSLQLGGSYRGSPPFMPEAFNGLMERFLYFEEVLNDAEIAALTTAPANTTGDYNDDGKVDAADYVVWRESVGTSVELPGDEIGGVIGDAHYNQWREHFGEPVGSSLTGNSIPEPSTIVFSFVAGVAMLGGIGRRKDRPTCNVGPSPKSHP